MPPVLKSIFIFRTLTPSGGGVLAKRHVFKLYSDRFDRFKARLLLFYFALSDLIDQGCFFSNIIYTYKQNI